MKYVVYHKNTGEIYCLRSSSSYPTVEDEYAVLEGDADPSSQYVVDGSLVNMPPRPSDTAVFDFSSYAWVEPTSTSDLVRAKREELLKATDWTQLPDVPEATRLKWQEYRQALRDITDQPGFPENVVWPEPPQ